jgi:hypothetical protein
MSTLAAFAWADRDCERSFVAFEKSDFAADPPTIIL